jgi:hypothetical protein
MLVQQGVLAPALPGQLSRIRNFAMYREKGKSIPDCGSISEGRAHVRLGFNKMAV